MGLIFAKDAYKYWPGPALILNIIYICCSIAISNLLQTFYQQYLASCHKCALDEPTANSIWSGQKTSTTKIVLTFVILLSLIYQLSVPPTVLVVP